MQLHVSPSLRYVTMVRGKGLKEFIKVKVGSRRFSYQMVFCSLLFFTFLLWFVLGKRLKPKILVRRIETGNVPEAMYQVLEQPLSEEELKGRSDIPQTLKDFMSEVKRSKSDASEFAQTLKEMVTLMEQRTRTAKIPEYLYRHVASSSIPKQLHCLALKLANEHSINAAARLQLPEAELVPTLVDNNCFHFVLASENVLAALVVAKSLVQNSLRPHKNVLHIITDRKTYFPMQAWFSLHSLSPAIVEVKAFHRFDWLSKEKVPVDSFPRSCPDHRSVLAYAWCRIPRDHKHL